jgi:hypothetical protein
VALVEQEMALYDEHAGDDPEVVSEWEFARYVEFT